MELELADPSRRTFTSLVAVSAKLWGMPQLPALEPEHFPSLHLS